MMKEMVPSVLLSVTSGFFAYCQLGLDLGLAVGTGLLALCSAIWIK